MENITLNQIAYSLLDMVRGTLSDDEDIDIREVKNWIHTTRAVILKQKFDKNIRVIDSSYTQSLGSVEMEVVNSSVDTLLQTDKYYVRSVLDIPSTIERSNSEGTFVRIGPADRKADKYNIISLNRAIYCGSGKFNKNSIYAFILDNKIYLSSNTDISNIIKYIDVIGVFQNPSQVAIFKDVNGDSLYSDDKEYPISRSIVATLEDMVIKSKLTITSVMPSDKINDSTHKLTNEQAKR